MPADTVHPCPDGHRASLKVDVFPRKSQHLAPPQADGERYSDERLLPVVFDHFK
jgi:hypothetical protein